MQRTFLFFGYGYTARALARRLAPAEWRIAATARGDEQAASLRAEGVDVVRWLHNGIDADGLAGADAALVSAPPDQKGCPAFRAAADAFAAAGRLAWLGYLSSNAVYGDSGGAWVDETSPLRPQTDRALARVAAEAEWAGFCSAHSIPRAIFRLPGIYGPGRSALDQVRAGSARRVFKEGQVFNRMHVDDIAAALCAALERPGAGELFNLSDDEPAPPQDVVAFACNLLGVDPPPLVTLEEAALSEMARSFYAESKRVANRRIKETLGVRLLYPTYREGLNAIFREETATD